MSGIVATPRAQELLARMAGGALYREAYEQGKTLSIWLEEQDPSSNYQDGLDAFSRMVKVAGIKVQSDPARGYYADLFQAFDRDDNTRALVPEWIARQWRRVSFGAQRSLFTSDADALGSVMRPYVDAAAARAQQLAPAIPLAELIAITTPIQGDAYRAFYLDDPTASTSRLVRVSEGAEIPRVTIKGGDHTTRLYKYGRALEMTYEVLRRQRIDKVAFWIQFAAVQAETDKVATAIDVLINGDGNPGTAATSYNLTALDSGATVGSLSLKAWLLFKLKFGNPYALTTTLAQEASALQMLLLNTGSGNVPLVNIQAAAGFGGIRPINPQLADNVGLGVTEDAPASQIVGFDRRFALERVTEIGANIQEVERWATRQTQALVLSEVEGYNVLDPHAAKILNLAA